MKGFALRRTVPWLAMLALPAASLTAQIEAPSPPASAQGRPAASRALAGLRLRPQALLSRLGDLAITEIIAQPGVRRFLAASGLPATWSGEGLAEQVELLLGVDPAELARAELTAMFLGFRTTRDVDAISVQPDLLLCARVPSAEAAGDLLEAAQPLLSAVTGADARELEAGQLDLLSWRIRRPEGLELFAAAVGRTVLLATSRATLVETAAGLASTPESSVTDGPLHRLLASDPGSDDVLCEAFLDLEGLMREVRVELPEEVVFLLGSEGLGRARALAYRLSVAAPGFRERLVVDAPDAGGLFAAMRSSGPAPGLPRGGEGLSLGFSWTGAHDALRRCAAGLDPRLVESLDELDAVLRAKTGAGLRADLLPALGDGLRVRLAWREVGPWPDLRVEIPVREAEVIDAILRRLGAGRSLRFRLPGEEQTPRRAVRLDRLVRGAPVGPAWCAAREGRWLVIAPWASALHREIPASDVVLRPGTFLALELDVAGIAHRGLELTRPWLEMAKPRVLGLRPVWSALPPSRGLARPLGRVLLRGERRPFGLMFEGSSRFPLAPLAVLALVGVVLP